MSAIEKKVFPLHDGDASIVIDSRFFPLIFVHWIGCPTIPVIDEYFRVRGNLTAYADEVGTTVIAVSDISRMQAPAATIRKYVAEHAAVEDNKYKSMHSYVVIVPSALVRGVVVAIQWMMGDKGAPISYVNSMELAIERALKVYDSLDIPKPDIRADAYSLPDYSVASE